MEDLDEKDCDWYERPRLQRKIVTGMKDLKTVTGMKDLD